MTDNALKILRLFMASLCMLVIFAAVSRAPSAAESPETVGDGDIVNNVGESEERDPLVEEIINEFGLWEDQTAEKRVDEIGRRLVLAAEPVPKGVKIGFILLDKDSINAFAMAEGHIFLFRGLIERAETDDQLASVMAHEMTHVLHGHHNKGQDAVTVVQIASLLAAIAAGEQEPVIAGQMISSALIESYGRDSEVDADLSGADLMMGAGYDPLGMIEFFSYMEGLQRRRPQLEGNYFTIHPYADERIENLTGHLESLGIKVPDDLYRLHLALDLDCHDVDGHFECIIFIGDEPAFTMAGDDEDELVERGYDIVHKLRDAFFEGLRSYEIHSREGDDGLYIEAKGSVLISVTGSDEKYLGSDAGAINAERLDKIKFILWGYYIERRI